MPLLLELTTTDASQAGTYTASLTAELVTYPATTIKVDFPLTVIYAINHLPAFDKKIVSATVQLTKTSQTWTLNLPKIVDADNDVVSLKADLGSAALCFVLQEKTALVVSDTKAGGPCKPGNHLIVFTLDDTKASVIVPISLVVLDLPAEPAPATSQPTAAQNSTESQKTTTT